MNTRAPLVWRPSAWDDAGCPAELQFYKANRVATPAKDTTDQFKPLAGNVAIEGLSYCTIRTYIGRYVQVQLIENGTCSDDLDRDIATVSNFECLLAADH